MKLFQTIQPARIEQTINTLTRFGPFGTLFSHLLDLHPGREISPAVPQSAIAARLPFRN